jgi:hypothetical protein
MGHLRGLFDLKPDPVTGELPAMIYMVQLAPGAEVLVDDETGEWIPRAGDPVTVTQISLTRVEDDRGDDLLSYQISLPSG